MDSATETTFFVATDGNDTWSGRLAEADAKGTDGPLATLGRARNAVRALKTEGSLTEPLTVLVRGGKYYLDKTLVFTEEDSGTRECPITYAAYPGEQPVLSGGRRLTGWEPHKGKILKCALPEARGGRWKFRQLFFNSERLETRTSAELRARQPFIRRLGLRRGTRRARQHPGVPLSTGDVSPTLGEALAGGSLHLRR